MKHYLLGILVILSFKAEAQTPASAVADSLYAVGNYSRALEIYSSTPQSAVNYLKIARSYKGLGNKAQALKAYKNSLKIHKEQPIAATEYGKMLLTRNKFAEADSIFGMLTARYPDNPEYHYQHGRALRKLPRDTTKSKEMFEKRYVNAFAKAVSLDSTHLKAIGQLALYHLQQSDYPEVEKLCFKALKSDSENIEIINLLAQNFYNRGFYTGAIDWFEKLVELGQKSAFIHEKLGYGYYQKRMYKRAIEQYKILLEYDNEDYGTYHILAKLYNYTKDKEKAIEASEKALYFKDLPLDDVYMTLGATYRLHKQWQEAIEQFQLAIKENPSEGNAYHNIAICADNYYKDKKVVVKLYQQFTTKFRVSPKYQYSIMLADERIKILNREIFMDNDGN